MAVAHSTSTKAPSALYTWNPVDGYSANLRVTAAWDYFRDACAVDDCIYICYYYTLDRFRVTIGTTFAATSVTFVWEAYVDGAWAELTLTKNEIGDFDVAGTKWMWFVPPIGFNRTNPISKGTHHWIRVRIDALDTPTEGGANSSRAYISPNQFNISGYSEATPCTIADVYAQDQSDASQLVEKNSDNSYFLRCSLYIASGAYFRSTEEYIEFNTHTFGVYFLGEFKLGQLSTDGNPIKGSFWKLCPYIGYGTRSSTGNCKIYASIVMAGAYIGGHTWATGATLDVQDSLGTADSSLAAAYQALPALAGTANIKNWFLHNMKMEYLGSFLLKAAISGTFENVNVKDCYCGVRCDRANTEFTIKNFTILDPSYATGYYQMSTAVNQTLNTVNCTPEPSAATCDLRTGTCLINYKYEFDLKIVDRSGDPISGAIVRIKDIDGTEITSSPFATDAIGDIIQQTIQAGKVEGTSEVVTSYTPHTVTISGAGYVTRTIVYTMDRAREEIEVLLHKRRIVEERI